MSQTASSPFLFLAVSPTGARRFGMRYAGDPAELSSVLTKDQLLLLRCWRLPKWTARQAAVSLRDQAALNEQLSLLLERGVPLIESLEVAESVVGKQTRPRIEKMRELVAGGASFADAAEEVGGFDDVTIAIYRAAERSGDLGPAAARLGEAARRRLLIAGKVGTMLIYPGVVLAIAVIVTIIVLTVVVPQISQTLVSMGADLPWYTRAVMGVSDAIRANALPALIIGGGVIVAVILGWRLTVRIVSAGLRRIKLFGDVMLASESARFFAVMGAMTRSGVPLADALTISSGAVADPRLRGQIETLSRKLVEGGVLRTLIDEVTALPLATRRLLIAADRAGDLDTVFDGLADDLAADVDKRTTRALSLLEPLLIVGLFIVVGGLLMSIMFPLITLSSNV